jgi:hypothetical protein
MTGLSQSTMVTPAQPVADAETPLAKAKESALNLMLSTQALIIGEFLFAASELFERTRTEIHLFSEFASKMAESHSVRDLSRMYQECSKHQIEFIRRDCDRIFQHGQRLVENASSLYAGPPQN